jgi:hypothetical protein
MKSDKPDQQPEHNDEYSNQATIQEILERIRSQWDPPMRS